MWVSKWCGRRVFAIVAVLTLFIPAAVGPGSPVRAQTNRGYELFYSEQTNFFFFWKPDIWSVMDRSSDDGADTIRLSNGHGAVSYSAFAAQDLSTTDCVRLNIGALEDDPSVIAVEALSDTGGSPEIHSGASELVLTVEGPEKYAVRVQCQDIDHGRSLLSTTVIVPAREYNELAAPLEIYDPIFISSFDFAQLEADGQALDMTNVSGEVGGTLTVASICLQHQFFVLASASRDGDGLQFDTSSFETFDEQGLSFSTAVTWYRPSASGTTVSMRPGETGLLHIEAVTDSFSEADLAFVTPDGQAIDLGIDSDDIVVGCGGAGGGAPVLIDID